MIKNPSIHSTFILTLSNGLRAVAQGLTFLIVAKLLSPSEYGLFVANLALAGTFAVLCGMGTHVLLIRDVSREPSAFGIIWGLNFLSLTLSSPLILLLYTLAAAVFLPNTNTLLLCLSIGVAEIIFWPLSNITVYAQLGKSKFLLSSLMALTPIILRLLLACLALTTSPTDSLHSWACIYLASAIASAIICQLSLLKDHKNIKWPDATFLVQKTKNALPFAIGGAAQKILLDTDKIILANLQNTNISGIYSAGCRLLDFAIVPIYAYLNAEAPKLFKENTPHKINLYGLKKTLFVTLTIAIFSSLCIYVFSPLIPHIIDPKYTEAIDVVRLLSLFPLLCAIRATLEFFLYSLDAQKLNMQAIMIGCITSISINVLLVTSLGWKGSVISTYITETIIILILVNNLLKIIKSSKPMP